MREFITFVAWLILIGFIHSKLWGGYEPPPEDSLIFFLIDAFVSFIIIAIVAGAINLLSKLFKSNS